MLVVRPKLLGRLGVLGLLMVGCRVAPPAGPPMHEVVWQPGFDPAALADGRPPEVGSLPPLAVRDFGPEGVADGHRIRVRFTRPVVDLRDPSSHPEVGISVVALSAEGVADRALEGQSRWTAPDALEWSPAASLPDATAFEAVLSAGLSVDEEEPLPELRWRFETPRPEVVIDEPWEPLGPRDAIRVWVDQPVEPEVLARALEVRLATEDDPRPRSIPVSVRVDDDEDEDGSLLVEPVGRWPRGATGTARVAAGFVGGAGPLPLDEPVSVEITTRDRLRLRSVECEDRRDEWCRSGPVTLRMSTEVPRESLGGVTVTPAPAGLMIYEGWDDDDGPTIEIDGELEADRRYVVTLPASLTDVHGQRLGRRRRVAFGRRELPPRPEQDGPAALWLSASTGTFVQPGHARLGILAEHLKEVRVRVVRLEGDSRLAWLPASERDERPWPGDGHTSTEQHELRPEGIDGRAELTIDLSRFGGQGDAFLVEVVPLARTEHGVDDPERPLRRVRGLYQISGLGAVAAVGPARGVVRVTDVVDGRPRAGVRASVRTTEGTVALEESDAHGSIRLPGAEVQGEDAWLWLEDPQHRDRLAVALRDFRWPSSRGALLRGGRMNAQGRMSWRPHGPESEDPAPPEGLRKGERAVLAVEAGRGIVLPSDTLHVVGWASISTPYRTVSTRRAPEGTPVRLELVQREEVLLTREVALDEHGRFDAEIGVPDQTPLGMLLVRATMLETSTATSVMLADARIPTFEVGARLARSEVVRGDDGRMHVRARYLSGEPAPLESVRWVMSCGEDWFAPRTDEGAWFYGVRSYSSWWEKEGTVEPPEARSHVKVDLSTEALAPGRTHRCSIAVAGQDATLQQVGTDTELLVHPASIYLGVHPPPDPDVGERLKILVQAVDLQGRRVAREGVELTVARELEPDEDGRERASEPVAECALDLDAKPGACPVGMLPSGSYLVTATTMDDEVEVRTETSFFVAPPPPPPIERTPPSSAPAGQSTRDESLRPLEIHVPEGSAAPGRAVEVEIDAPWDGSGMLVVGQTGLREVHPFTLRDGKAKVDIVPRAGRGPEVELRASVARPGGSERLPRVLGAHGRIWMDDQPTRELELSLEAPEHAEPGTTVPLRMSVRDRQGRPVDARIALWVVDEGMHMLRGPHRVHLVNRFDPGRPGLEQWTQSYDELLGPFTGGGRWPGLRRVPVVRQARAAVKGALDYEIRQRFQAVPLFVGNQGTGPDGVLELSVPLPDDLTRFRVSAIASAELAPEVGEGSGPARFGRAEATIEVAAPLMVRAVLPRVLRPGDRARVGALVTPPEGGGRLEVSLGLDGSDGVMSILGPTRAERVVDGQGPVRIDFEVDALASGEAEVVLLARLVPERGKALRSGVRRPLAVAVERTQVERAAIHGRLDGDEPVAIPVLVPEGARADHGGLSLTVRGTMIGELDEAARYLVEYPYGCLEQTASRLVPLVAVGRLREHLPPGVGDPEATIAEGLARLVSMQLPDGRFGYWPGNTEPAEFAGAYATWVMTMAADAGYPVSERALSRALDALAAGLEAPLPSTAWMRQEARVERAIAVHVLVAGGRRDLPAIGPTLDDLVSHRDELPVFARAMLLMAAHGVDPQHERVATLRRQVLASLERAGGAAYPVEPVDHRWARWFDSSTRSHAMVLMAMMQLDPEAEVVHELAHGLRRRREGGRWRNTQENAYGLLALADYAERFETETPDHRLDVWLGAGPVSRVEQRGRGAAPVELRRSMQQVLGPLGTDRTTNVVIDREGRGPVFYRLGMEWATEGAPAVRSQGMALSRRLLDRDAEELGSEALQAGQRYQLEVVLLTEAPQHYVAIDVPLPAGLEAIDSSLGAGTAARGLARSWSPWVSHQQLHRDRVLVFADELPPGEHIVRIPVLATTPGRFSLPSAVAEAMYAPEIRARTAPERVRIDAAR